jgi:signal transduction histidine kinase
LSTEKTDLFELIKGKIDGDTFEEMKKVISFLSHELKRPLSSAVLSLHTVKDGYLGDLTDSQKEMLDSVATDLDRMTSVIVEILDEPRRRLSDDE